MGQGKWVNALVDAAAQSCGWKRSSTAAGLCTGCCGHTPHDSCGPTTCLKQHMLFPCPPARLPAPGCDQHAGPHLPGPGHAPAQPVAQPHVRIGWGAACLLTGAGPGMQLLPPHASFPAIADLHGWPLSSCDVDCACPCIVSQGPVLGGERQAHLPLHRAGPG